MVAVSPGRGYQNKCVQIKVVHWEMGLSMLEYLIRLSKSDNDQLVPNTKMEVGGGERETKATALAND